jgi:exonuclease SbcC
MQIRALTLQNIRSYTAATLTFEKGLTLLAGDIGSGKSTILLALEFALFGIQRGELSGSALLRHGCQSGKVSLSLEIDGKEITIQRGLKRNNTGIGQETGSITIDGVTTELTAVELKAKVLELLNYPPSLLSTGKRPLFRYTVYTPQEEMKAILYEKAEERLETLRRLFNIDKYKRVRENTLTFLKDLRKEETDLSARVEELTKLVEEGFDLEQLKELTGKKALCEKDLLELSEKAKQADEALATLEKERFELEEQKKALALTKSRVEMLQQRREEVITDEKEVAAQIAGTDLQKSDVDETKLQEQEKILREHEEKIAAKERAVVTQEAEHTATIKRVDELIAKISQLDTCPTCQQPVTVEHKTHIDQEEGQKKLVAETKLLDLESIKEKLAGHKRQLREKQAELLEKQKLVAANKEKLVSLERLQKKLTQIGEAKEKLTADITAESGRITALESALSGKSFDQESYELKKRAATEAQKALSEKRMEQLSVTKDIERLEAEKEKLEKKKAEMEAYTRQLQKVREKATWLQKQLINVSHTIEKQLFSSVYGLFNEYFKEWFSTLMEDESLSVRLDSDFAPVIVQDGYETTIENLSGGEKTSVALAYRLSLNKAINEFLTEIKTSDLLILDEPTDGFSTEQLDRVREVLDQLQLQQILIVSHEQQMEGYVDHVLRIAKTGHESRVA